MNRVSAEARQGARGWDTIQVITKTIAEALKAEFDFGVRYLGTLTSPEVDVILGAGMALMAVTYGIKHGTPLNATLGANYGASSVKQAQTAGIPKGNTLWLDVEDCTGSAQDADDFVNSWVTPVRAAGFIPGMYDGAGIPLTAEQLGALGVNRYWHSCSNVIVPTYGGMAIGFCMQQLFKPNVPRAGILVDLNVVQHDFRGRLPVWTQAA